MALKYNGDDKNNGSHKPDPDWQPPEPAADLERVKLTMSMLAVDLPWYQRPAVIQALKTIVIAILLAILSLLGYEQVSVQPRLQNMPPPLPPYPITIRSQDDQSLTANFGQEGAQIVIEHSNGATIINIRP